MLQQRSKLSATSLERPRLTPPWLVAGTAALIVSLLALVFPEKTLIRRVAATAPEEDALAAAYLANLLRTAPDNPELRLVLARSQYRLGQTEAAERTLAPALASPDPQVREDAEWLRWMISVRSYEALPPDAPERLRIQSQMRAEVERLAKGHWSESMMLELVTRAFAIGGRDLGLRLVQDLASRRDDLGLDWFGRVAASALGRGDYDSAAALQLIIRSEAATLPERRRAYIAALRALQSGNRTADALALGERELKDLSDDREALEALIGIARAANRPDIADKYVRRLLRMVLLEQWRRLAEGPGRIILAAAEAGGGPALPFDDRAYTLGYEVFLNNRKPEDAYRVAASAVRQAPGSLVWRERLARVGEWSGHPQVSLENWLYLARRTGRDEYWQNVLRLAPGLFDDEALLAGLQYQLGKEPGDPKLVKELVDAYERLGRPRQGLEYLQRLRGAGGRDELLEPIADLAERAGDLDAALAAWSALFATREPTLAQALKASTLMVRVGRTDEALAVLDRARPAAADRDADYWRLSGELAQIRQREAQALDAYRRLLAGGLATATDYDAAVALLREVDPVEAARVAATAWRRFGNPARYMDALGMFAAQERWNEMGELLAAPDARARRAFARQPDYLRLRAAWYQHRGKRTAAARDLEAALALAPDAAETRQALLWLAIDGNDPVLLRRLLAAHEADWARDASLHDALAAAWQALSRPKRALDRYLTPRLADHRGDFLWLMNYADALEEEGDADRAWLLRQALWQQARRERDALPPAGDVETESARRAARTRLEISQRGGDRGLAALRDLLRLDRDGQGRLGAAARELALSWLQNAPETAAERGYLWQQYGRSLARPLWADISVALAEDDRAALGELLDRYGERLPRHDRVNAAMRLGDVRRAQSDAFETMADEPFDDPLHQDLGEALFAHSDSARGLAAAREVGAIGEQERAAGAELSLSPQLKLSADFGEIRRASRDETVITGVPGHETYARLGLRLHGRDSETRLGGEQRDGLARYHPLAVEHERRIDNRLSLQAGLGLRQRSEDSAAMQVGGMKDHANLGLTWQFSQRERLSVEWVAERYSGQTGTRLGKGGYWGVELAVPLRAETPDLEFSAFQSQHRFRRNGEAADPLLETLIPAGSGVSAADFYLPNDFRFYGVRVSSNMRFAGATGQYSRALRPYASAAWTHHSEAGPGYDLELGVATSLFGADRLELAYALAKGGTTSFDHVRQFTVHYRLNF